MATVLHRQSGLFLLAALCLFARPLLAQPMTIGLYNYPRLSPDRLDRTLGNVSGWFGSIGIETRWQDLTGCVTGGSTAPPVTCTAAPDLIVILATEQMADILAPARQVVGLAPRTRTRHGRLAYVFCDRVEAVPFATDVDWLAVVIAHEIGHLLLPRGSHSPRGVMRAAWTPREIKALEPGRLGFSKLQAQQISRRLTGRDAHVFD